MFDIGFTELILISVVALLVLGPERLPGAIRTMGLWVGRLRRSFNSIKSEIEKEIGADEIRRQLRNEEIMEKFRSSKNQFTDSINSVKAEAESIKKDISMADELAAFTGKPVSKAKVDDPVDSLTAQTAPGSKSEPESAQADSAQNTEPKREIPSIKPVHNADGSPAEPTGEANTDQSDKPGK